jgi:3-dehydroquinate dehydratase/shikimate dehydrogenase
MTDVIATLTAWPDGLSTMPDGVTHLQVRADLAGDVEPARLRRCGDRGLVYTLRSRAHGGRAADPPRLRRARLAAAVAAGYDVVDLEADHDLDPDLLAAVPPQRRRICWHGGEQTLTQLRAMAAAMTAVPAAGYLLAPAASTAEAALAPLRLLAALRRQDVTAYGTGPAGTWSRVLAPWLGAPAVSSQLTTVDKATPDIARLCGDFPFSRPAPLRELYGLIGAVAPTSGLVRQHNRAYGQRGVPGLLLPFYLPGLGDFLSGFWPGVPAGLAELGLPVRGLCVSGPLKEAALRVAQASSPAARAAGAANALVRRRGRWQAETTDTSAVAAVLRRARIPLAHRPAFVVGCGGAGRAAAVALREAGADVTMVNRGEARGRLAAELLGLPFAPLEGFRPSGAALIVHATTVHKGLPFPLDGLGDGAAVVDMVCPPDGVTALVTAARRRGLRTVDGRQVLAVESAHQFRLMTGRTMPPAPTAGAAKGGKDAGCSGP